MSDNSPMDDPTELGPDRSLDFEGLLSDGVDGLLSVTGAQLVVILAGLGLVSRVLWQSLYVQFLEGLISAARETLDTTDPEVQSSLTELETTIETLGTPVDVSLPVIVAGVIVLAVLSEAIMIVAARAFAETDLDGISAGLATRRLTIATLYGFLGGLLLLAGISLGLVLVVVPGLVLYVGTIFFRQEVAIADSGPIDAITESWTLTKGHRWTLLGVAVVLWIIGYVATAVFGFVPGTAGTVGVPIANSAVGVFAVAVITSAYVRLRDETVADVEQSVDESEWNRSA